MIRFLFAVLCLVALAGVLQAGFLRQAPQLPQAPSAPQVMACANGQCSVAPSYSYQPGPVIYNHPTTSYYAPGYVSSPIRYSAPSYYRAPLPLFQGRFSGGGCPGGVCR